MNRGLTKDEIFAQLTEKYEINRDKLELAYATAVNQQPILENQYKGSKSVCFDTVLSDKMQLLFICFSFHGFSYKAHAPIC